MYASMSKYLCIYIYMYVGSVYRTGAIEREMSIFFTAFGWLKRSESPFICSVANMTIHFSNSNYIGQ